MRIKVVHLYYIHNVVMLNCKGYCPGHGAEVEAYIVGGGGGQIRPYMEHVFLLKVMVVCYTLTIRTSSRKLYGKLSLGNTN